MRDDDERSGLEQKPKQENKKTSRSDGLWIRGITKRRTYKEQSKPADGLEYDRYEDMLLLRVVVVVGFL